LITGHSIDAEKLFTTISLLNNIIHPLNVLPWLYDNIMRSKRSFDKFINLMKKKEIYPLSKSGGDNCITLNNISLQYNKKSQFTLTVNDPIIAKVGEITMLYGNNATGKSLLLSSLVNEAIVIKQENSMFNIPSKKISYISQDLWTFNDSIKNNICLGEDSGCYSDIVERCCLRHDLNIISEHTGIYML
jgi:subfamily B ATP-binding cassette protein MsbA